MPSSKQPESQMTIMVGSPLQKNQRHPLKKETKRIQRNDVLYYMLSNLENSIVKFPRPLVIERSSVV